MIHTDGEPTIANGAGDHSVKVAKAEDAYKAYGARVALVELRDGLLAYGNPDWTVEDVRDVIGRIVAKIDADPLLSTYRNV